MRELQVSCCQCISVREMVSTAFSSIRQGCRDKVNGLCLNLIQATFMMGEMENCMLFPERKPGSLKGKKGWLLSNWQNDASFVTGPTIDIPKSALREHVWNWLAFQNPASELPLSDGHSSSIMVSKSAIVLVSNFSPEQNCKHFWAYVSELSAERLWTYLSCGIFFSHCLCHVFVKSLN